MEYAQIVCRSIFENSSHHPSFDLFKNNKHPFSLYLHSMCVVSFLYFLINVFMWFCATFVILFISN